MGCGPYGVVGGGCGPLGVGVVGYVAVDCGLSVVPYDDEEAEDVTSG